jgi:light-harvesting protein B-800-850 alpha chain
MNNAKMWLVLPPAVGVPLFLGAVAVGSFAVHVAVLSNTSWVADFLSGDQMASAILLDTDVEAARAASVLPSYEGGMEVTIIIPDGTPAKAILQPPEINASLTTGAAPLVVSQ